MDASSENWGSAAPVFRVDDLRASVAYYTDVLGFTIDWDYPDIVSVSRGRWLDAHGRMWAPHQDGSWTLAFP